MSTKVITGLVTFSYANVFKPRAANEGEDAKYGTAIIIPKKDKKTIEKIKKAIAAAREAGKVKLGKVIEKNFKTPLRDGDEEKPDDEAYADSYFLNANSSSKPGVVDEEVEPIIDHEEFYSGCKGRASINFYAFNSNGNKGIAAGLNNVQKLEDGDRLSGGSSAAEDFGDDSDDDLLD